MITIIEKAVSRLHSEIVLDKAVQILKNGGLVAFPTETVYGLGANVFDKNAAEKIYKVKGRPADNPLIVHINSFNMLQDVTDSVSELGKILADAFWPGPLTLIMRKSAEIPFEATGGLDTVGVRYPSHKTALRLIEKCGFPIAAPSANCSGRPSPTRASHVAYDLSGKIDMIIDGGSCEIGLESTIVDITGNMPVILRPGSISKEDITAVIKSFIADRQKLAFNDRIACEADSNGPPMAPGTKYRHYSPNAEIIIVKGLDEAVAHKINSLAAEAENAGKKVGALVTDEVRHLYNEGHIISVGSVGAPTDVGRNLFKVLRKFDFYGLDVVFSVAFPEKGIGAAIMNRLMKASGNRVISFCEEEGIWTD